MKEEIENLFEEILEKYKDTEYYANIDYYGSEEELTKANIRLDTQITSYRERLKQLLCNM